MDTAAKPESPASPSGTPSWDSLPDELLVQVFGHLAVVGCHVGDEEDPHRLTRLPYRLSDLEVVPPIGLRDYPFLAQVCKRWKRILATPMTQSLLWRQVCVDFGHELVTSIHTPLRWSNQRPSAAEYQAAFATTTISANKVLRFLTSAAPSVRCLTLANSEGYQRDDGEHVSLVDKHDFGTGHLGFALALMRNTLTELLLHRCDDLVTGGASLGIGGHSGLGGGGGSGVWSLAAQLPSLRVLGVEGLRTALASAQLAALSDLQKLEGLAITADPLSSDWMVGLEGIPPGWSRLTALTRLELRGHSVLATLPPWLPSLPSLAHLDVSNCPRLELTLLPQITRLQVLVLQNLSLGHEAAPPAEIAAAMREGRPVVALRTLPDLQPLASSLRSFSLAANAFTHLPPWLFRLTRLEHLDVSGNPSLYIRAPLTPLASLPYIALLDFRAVHASADDDKFWCEAKCTTMQHLAQLARLLRRRHPAPRLLMPAIA